MANFSFKKNVQVKFVYDNGGGVSTEDFIVQDISFSQTFTEESYRVKTLSDTNYFEGSVINKANPANFEFSVYFSGLNQSNIEYFLRNRLLLPKAITNLELWVYTENQLFRLEKCVFTNGVFVIERSQPLRMTISGEATKLSSIDTDNWTNITGEGNIYAGYQEINVPVESNKRYEGAPRLKTVTLGGTDISSCVTSIQLELQNDIQWNPYTTLHGALSATNAATSMFPSDFTIDKKILSGNITRYIKKDNPDLLNWNQDTTLEITVAATTGAEVLYFNFPNTSFTNRLNTSDIFTESYDFRMTTGNDSNIANRIIVYNTGAP
jgi:hypothetical protein